MSEPHKVIVVEDDTNTRLLLTRRIDSHPDLQVVAEAGTLASAQALFDAGDSQCDALLVDLGLPDGDGCDLIARVAGLPAGPEIMVITVFGDERHVINALEAGASGYLLKDAPAESLADSILSLLAGGSPISPTIARHVLRRFRPAPPNDDPEVTLTPREREVLHLVSRGMTNREIAELLEMSQHTVVSHIKHIYRKLAVRSRTAAVFEAQQLGLLPPRA